MTDGDFPELSSAAETVETDAKQAAVLSVTGDRVSSKRALEISLESHPTVASRFEEKIRHSLEAIGETIALERASTTAQLRGRLGRGSIPGSEPGCTVNSGFFYREQRVGCTVNSGSVYREQWVDVP